MDPAAIVIQTPRALHLCLVRSQIPSHPLSLAVLPVLRHPLLSLRRRLKGHLSPRSTRAFHRHLQITSSGLGARRFLCSTSIPPTRRTPITSRRSFIPLPQLRLQHWTHLAKKWPHPSPWTRQSHLLRCITGRAMARCRHFPPRLARAAA